MSTFLEAVQDLARELDLPSVPSSAEGQSGEFLDVVRWYQQAYRDIENRHTWRWLRRTATLSTTASDGSYTSANFTDTTDSAAISRFGSWRVTDRDDPPKIYLSSAGVGGERWLIYTPWEWFKSIYDIGTQVDGAPAHIAVDPNNNIRLGPKPDSTYVVTLDYYMSPQTLDEDEDEPAMPARYHDLIIYRAMVKYGYREAAGEVISRAKEEAARLMRQLENDQMEPWRDGGTFA